MSSAQHIAINDRFGAGIACQFTAVLMFTCMSSLIKSLGTTYPTSEIIFFRSLPALIPLLLYLPSQGGWQALTTRRPLLQTVRTVAGLASMFCGFYAISQLYLADYVALSFTAPLFGTLLSIPLLGERVGARRLLACLAGFIGIVIMVQPGSSSSLDLDVPVIMALVSAFLYGVVMVTMRRLGGTDNSAATVFYFTVGCTVVSGVVMSFEWVTPTWTDLALLVVIGLLGGIGQIFMTQAFRLAPPAIVAPFDYTAMIWALAIGWFVFGNFPAATSLLGAGIICLSGLFILYRETALGSRKTPLKRTSI